MSANAQWPTGNQAVQQVENWPLYREGVICGQVSSADPTGGDADGTGYLYQQDSLCVIFDQDGPGCVYRLWIRDAMGSSSNRIIKIYFDNQPDPAISTTVGTLFNGLFQNFRSPLVGNWMVSSGGDYCYLPLPYPQHLKIALVGGVLAHQATYQQYPPGTAVQPYNAMIPDTLLQQWLSPGSDPKNTAGNVTSTGALTLAPNQTQTLLSLTGSGSITGLRLTLSPATLTALQSVRLRCWWDNVALPQVDCPVGAFFANSLGLAPAAGLPLGEQNGEFYCYFPMPFWQNARMELYNTSVTTSANAYYTVTYKTDPYSDESGYFCASQRPYTNSQPGQDLILGELAGHGQLAGMTVTLVSTAGQNYLHGDMRLYTDGLAYPLMQGTDFDGDVNAGNYFSGSPFSRPVHGAPSVQNSAEQKVCAYRFFLGDLIPFASSLSLRAEHGNRNSVPLTYSSVVYSYSRPEIALDLSDELDVGDAASEQAHGYSVQGGQTSQSHFYAYPGTYDEQYFSESGRTIFGTSSFTVNVDPANRGVRLVRLKDASVFPQKVTVKVNGDSIGLWSDPDYNYYKRWGQSFFEIPVQHTQGQSQLQISLASQPGNQGWTEYRYWAYSHIPPRIDNTPPDQVANVVAENPESGFQMRLSWDAAADDNGVACYRIYRSSSPGVQPTPGFLVGQTPLISFTDDSLTPGAWYYYRVCAVDYSGNPGAPSSEIAVQTSPAFQYEAELLPVSAISLHDSAYAQDMIAYGESWSNQAQERFDANAIGDYFTQLVNMATADSYQVAAYFTKGPDYGMLIVKMDGQPVGSPVDLYAPLVTHSSRIECGSVYLDVHNHEIAWEVVNRNGASSGYNLGVDDVLLTPFSLLGVSPFGPVSQPLDFRLYQNQPNPFNASTVARYELRVASHVKLTVWDTAGRLVTTLVDAQQVAGQHSVMFDGSKLASGLYFVRMQAGGYTAARKMVLMK